MCMLRVVSALGWENRYLLEKVIGNGIDMAAISVTHSKDYNNATLRKMVSISVLPQKAMTMIMQLSQ